jgi:hypothetical protein
MTSEIRSVPRCGLNHYGLYELTSAIINGAAFASSRSGRSCGFSGKASGRKLTDGKSHWNLAVMTNTSASAFLHLTIEEGFLTGYENKTKVLHENQIMALVSFLLTKEEADLFIDNAEITAALTEMTRVLSPEDLQAARRTEEVCTPEGFYGAFHTLLLLDSSSLIIYGSVLDYMSNRLAVKDALDVWNRHLKVDFEIWAENVKNDGLVITELTEVVTEITLMAERLIYYKPDGAVFSTPMVTFDGFSLLTHLLLASGSGICPEIARSALCSLANHKMGKVSMQAGCIYNPRVLYCPEMRHTLKALLYDERN